MHFRLSASSGEVIDEGDGQVTVEDGTVTVSPQLGQPLRITPEQISEVGEPVPFTVRLRLSDGSTVDLSQLGTVRTQLLSQIGGVRVAGAHSGLVTIGFGERQGFHGAVDDVEADIGLYDDGMVAIPVNGLPVQAPYAAIDDVTTDPSGYRISIAMGSLGTVVVQRLAQTTSQFLTLLRSRATAERGRTAAFLQTLLPGLGPLSQRQVAGQLRDGSAVPRSVLDPIDPGIWPTLLGAATVPDRVACAQLLQTLGEASLGFRQDASVEVAAEGTTHFAEAGPVQSTGPGMGQATGPDMSMMGRVMGMSMAERAIGVPQPGGGGGPLIGGPAGGMAGMGMGMGGGRGMGMGMGMGYGAPFGAMGGMLAMRMLRGDGAWSGGGQAQAQSMFRVPEAEPAAGGLTPAHTDFSRLTTGGDQPTIMAFLIVHTASGAIYETLNADDHATYVFREPSLDTAQLNAALLLIGFHIEVLAGDFSGVGSRYAEAVRQLPHLSRLAAAFKGRVIHGDGWEQQLRSLIS